MKAKKIILFIVEGITDKICLGYVLNQLLSDNKIEFKLTNGDITSEASSKVSNIAAKIGSVIKDFSGKVYKPKDFLEVVHLVDTDGAYISKDNVIFAENEKPIYTNTNILSNKVSSIQQRNKEKSNILNRLTVLNKVYRTIPYSVYFFSANLDHVLHNNANLTREEKSNCAELFEMEYGDNPEGFLRILNEYACNNTDSSYTHTWEFVKLDAHSLMRYTNFNLYFSNPKNPR